MTGQLILFVDDEEMLVTLAKETLEDLGYRVTGQTCSQEALRIFNKNPYEYDLVITDYNMPKMNGGQFAENLRDTRQDIPIILSTGRKNISKTTIKIWGIDEIIIKPYQFEEMDSLIKRIMGLCWQSRS